MHHLFKKTILCICALLLVCTTICSCALVPISFSSPAENTSDGDNASSVASLPEPPEGLAGYYYDQLNKNEKSPRL